MYVPFAVSSGQKSASALIVTGRTLLTHVSLTTNSAADATITVYDNTAGSGKIVWYQKVPAAEEIGGRNLDFPVDCETGIYVVITGTGAKYIVEHTQEAVFLKSSWSEV